MDFERHSYTEVVHILLNELNNMRYEYAVSKVPGCSQGRAVVAVLPQSGRFEETVIGDDGVPLLFAAFFSSVTHFISAALR